MNRKGGFHLGFDIHTKVASYEGDLDLICPPQIWERSETEVKTNQEPACYAEPTAQYKPMKNRSCFSAVKKIQTTFGCVIRTTHEDEESEYDDNGLSKYAAHGVDWFVPGEHITKRTFHWFAKNTMLTIGTL